MILDILLFAIGPLSLIVVINRYYVSRVILYFNKRKGKKGLPPRANISDEFLPAVTVIVPCYNEGEGIYHTIRGLLASNYPRDKFEVIVVDDCSSDDSVEWAERARRLSSQVRILRNEKNIGKRRGIHRALHVSSSPFVVSVDSDVIVDMEAIRILIATFDDERIAAVGGKVKVHNTNQNWLTKMQTVKYYFGYEFLKVLENSQRQVMCLSGCLTAYRRKVLLDLEHIVENRNILGISIKYGEDRFLTRQIVKAGHQTVLNLRATCSTVAPPTLAGYFKQQLRWRRSNFVDFLGILSHLHKLRPVIAFHYMTVAGLQFVYPLVILLHLFYGKIFFMLIFHLIVLLILCLFYLRDNEYSLPGEKVNPIWFLTMGALMPVTYLFLSPLAILTLDSGSWETRNKGSKVSFSSVWNYFVLMKRRTQFK